MKTTNNYGLKKPEQNDYVNIEDLNYNADAIDQAMQENKTKRADLKLSNLDTPQEALANLGAGVRPNLHDNWFFPNVGGFPISQKGGTSLDRWGSYNLSVELLQKGVKLTSTGLDSYLAQYTENAPLYAGENLTLSAIVKDISGEAYAKLYAYNGATYTTVSSNKVTSDDLISTTVRIPEDTISIFSRLYVTEGGSATFVASKLEEGEGQTLGYKKTDGSLVMLPQSGKKPSQMLAECQRYYIPFKPGSYIGRATSANSAQFIVPIPVQMRTTPVLSDTLGSNWGLQDYNGEYKNLTGVKVYSSGVSASYITLFAESNSLFTPGAIYTLSRLSSAGDWAFSCELGG